MEPKIYKCFLPITSKFLLIHPTLNYSSLTGGALQRVTQKPSTPENILNITE